MVLEVYHQGAREEMSVGRTAELQVIIISKMRTSDVVPMIFAGKTNKSKPKRIIIDSSNQRV